jgi:hypothetical protein
MLFIEDIMKYFLLDAYKNDKFDIGLKPTENSQIFILSEDNSEWRKYEDFFELGYGGCGGYYRYPMPPFEKLVDLLFGKRTDIFDGMNAVGAAGALVLYYPMRLREKITNILDENKSGENYLDGFNTLDPYLYTDNFNPQKISLEERGRENIFWFDIREKVKNFKRPFKKNKRKKITFKIREKVENLKRAFKKINE